MPIPSGGYLIPTRVGDCCDVVVTMGLEAAYLLASIRLSNLRAKAYYTMREMPARRRSSVRI